MTRPEEQMPQNGEEEKEQCPKTDVTYFPAGGGKKPTDTCCAEDGGRDESGRRLCLSTDLYCRDPACLCNDCRDSDSLHTE
jgi:hypothetical protein